MQYVLQGQARNLLAASQKGHMAGAEDVLV